jgi:hypothetical protein
MKRCSRALGSWLFALGLASAPVAAEEPAATPPAADTPPAQDEPRAVVPRLFAELLFLRPTLDDTAFVIVSRASSTFPNGKRESDEFDHEPAFRIGAGYEIGDTGRSVELSYARLEAEATETVGGNSLWATVGHPDFATSFENYQGTASADIDADYQRIDLHVTQPWEVSGVDLGIEFGLEWADFRVGEGYRFVNNDTATTGVVSMASRSWGIGPEIGLGLGFEICSSCGIPGAFSLSAGSSLALLLTDTNLRASSAASGAPLVSIRDDETSRVIPAIHARAGFSYAVPLAERVAATAGVGYEIDTYLNGLTRASFVDDVGQAIVSTRDYDFDLQGVYLALGVIF